MPDVRREEIRKKAKVKPFVAHVKDHVRREEIRKRANICKVICSSCGERSCKERGD